MVQAVMRRDFPIYTWIEITSRTIKRDYPSHLMLYESPVKERMYEADAA
jgi:hypothetical protein